MEPAQYEDYTNTWTCKSNSLSYPTSRVFFFGDYTLTLIYTDSSLQEYFLHNLNKIFYLKKYYSNGQNALNLVYSYIGAIFKCDQNLMLTKNIYVLYEA